MAFPCGGPSREGPVRGQRITLGRNDAYWGQQPYLDRVVFRPLPDPSARVAALRAAQRPAGAAEADGGGAAGAAAVDDEPHVEAQVDQEVYDQLIAGGAAERVARAKAKAA